MSMGLVVVATGASVGCQCQVEDGLHQIRQDSGPGCDTSEHLGGSGRRVAMLETGWQRLHDERRPQRIGRSLAIGIG
jgi:hypothetical protein